MTADDRRTDASERMTAVATPGEGTQSGLTPRKVFVGALVLSLVTFVVMAVFGVLWWTSATGEESDVASARDEVVQQAAEGVKAITEFDYRDLDGAKNRQLAVATDEMRAQIEQAWKSRERGDLEKNKRSATTTIFDIAVDELNVREGKAKVLAAVEVKITDTKDNGVQRLRFQADMERVDDVWKLAAIYRL